MPDSFPILPAEIDQPPTAAAGGALPAAIAGWFAQRGWRLHAHQAELLAHARAGRSALLIAPTGGGKTLAGFLPSLVEIGSTLMAAQLDGEPAPPLGLHTLYISPLKALAVDVHRNLLAPIAEIGLPIRAETRTGDTPAEKRRRQRMAPPHMLMTTPESLALLLSFPDAPELFKGLGCVIVDELHALAGTKRGDQLALGLARLASLAPSHRRIGLSATVADPAALRAYLSKRARAEDRDVATVVGGGAKDAQIEILDTSARLPWSGHMGAHAAPEIYGRLKEARTAIVFVNTRAQAEILFQELWRLNEDGLAIALHHGSLAAEQRRKVEAAMAAGRLRAVVATSSLDLGIDWASVDLVVQVGAPKGVSRLLQRVGRSNHRLGEASRALLVPANRFEVLECRAALAAIDKGVLDGRSDKPGGLDVLCQHILGTACASPFDADALYAEVTRAAPYAALTRRDFDDCLAFVAGGGYALAAYERWRRIGQRADGLWTLLRSDAVRQFRLNIGTIVETPLLKVRLGRARRGGSRGVAGPVAGGRVLGEIEEYFVQGLVPGDSFIFAGEHLRYEGIAEASVIVTRAAGGEPKVPAYAGGRLPLSTHLADGVRALLADPEAWARLPGAVQDWLAMQRLRSVLPEPAGLLVESFPRAGREWLVIYAFEGRNAHQTLGMLLTRRMERAGLKPIGFVATDYVLATWSMAAPRPEQMADLFGEDMLGDDLEEWMADSSLLKRSFRHVAVIAGLIERRHPGQEKSGRQVTISSDLIYDVLRAHEPGHVLLRATRADAATGLTDVGRLGAFLKRIAGRLRLVRLERVSPLAVPVLLEVGREQVSGAAHDAMLEEAAAGLIEEAMG